jgi:hypothetical protein
LASGAAAAVISIASGQGWWTVAAVGLAGAALARLVAALRIVDEGPGATVGGAVAAALAPMFALDVLGGLSATGFLAVAAAAAAACELAVDDASLRRCALAMAPAALAIALEPAFAALAPLTAVRWFAAASRGGGPSLGGRRALRRTLAFLRYRDGRIAALVPLAGVSIAIAAIAAHDAELVDHGPRAALARLGDVLGPIAACAALAGLAVAAVRGRLAGAAVVACAIGALLVDAVAPGRVAALALAALCTGVGVARLAGSIRVRAGQAIAAATCAVIVALPPAWIAIERALAR